MDAPAKHKNHDIYFVPGLFRGLRVLEILAAEEKPLTVSEIARALDVSRSSAFRLIYTLKYMGFAESTDDGRNFKLGARVLNLGFSYLASQDIITTARADLEDLRDETGISAHLAILEKQEVLFLDCVQSRSGFLSNVNVGTRIPAHASPLGWLMLSDLPSRELAARYEGATFKRLTEKTPTNTEQLLHAVSQAAAHGVVVSQGIAEQGGCSISAPVLDRNGKIIAAIDISGPASAFEAERMESDYVSKVRAAAMSISRRLGYVA
ncbi:IclR family transcriptional regulator [Pelagibius sp. CAU 1746]|uniref:IclR family transcriptional regulator n=1 Tax=Pelagibius sp. CAU 1746 TaxID=3140370 RepID=UPI00325BA789